MKKKAVALGALPPDLAEALARCVEASQPKWEPDGTMTAAEFAAKRGISVTTAGRALKRCVQCGTAERVTTRRPTTNGLLRPVTGYKPKETRP